MRLLKADKEAFVRAVMDDVPSIDYDEQARKLVEEWSFARMPAEVRAAVEKHPDWFERAYVNMPYGLSNVSIYMETGGRYRKLESDKKLWDKLAELGNLANKQSEKLCELQHKVNTMIYSCSTLKTARERLPEFEKYLPADRDGTGAINLPIITNVVADLTKAGWPKGVTAK